MEIARIEVGRTTGTCTRRGRIPAGIVGASVQVSFTDPVWHNLIKTVVFRGKETRIAEFDGAVAVIPHEVVAEPGVTLYFGIFGHDPDSDLQIPLIEVRLGTTEAATDANADPGTDPTLPIWAQLQQEIEEIKQKGPGSGGGGNVVPVETAYGTTIILNDSTDKSLQGLKIYGKTFQNGTPTPDTPVPLVSPGDDGKLTATIGVSLGDTVPQTISISTPNGMPGIPVTSGGNYTDTSGQQWICDEVDFAKGVYIQRIVRYVFKGTEPFQRSTYTYWVPLSDIGLSLANVKAALCNWYTFTLTNANAAQTPGVFDFYCPAPDFITPNQVRMSTDGFDTVGAFKTALSEAYDAGNPMYCLFVLDTPVETALTESELTAYADLHTIYPSTAIANDGFANMEVSYMAIGDTSPVNTSTSGTNIILNNSTDESLQGLKLFGKTFQNGTPTPESPVELISPGDDGSLTVTIGVSISDTVPQAVVCAEISTSQASGFWAEAKLDESDFSLEYVSSKNNADWVKTSLNRLITACMNSDGTDLDTTVGRYLDWNSAIDFYIFNVLIGSYDCVRKNYILVTLDGKKWYFSAYDMDSTFGLKWTGKGFLYSRDAEPTPSIYSVRHKVMQLIATYKKDELKARYEYIRKNVLPEYVVHGDFYNFSYEIPKIVLEEDWRKWPSIPNTHGSTIAQILDWYRTRIEYMDAEMEAL